MRVCPTFLTAASFISLLVATWTTSAVQAQTQVDQLIATSGASTASAAEYHPRKCTQGCAKAFRLAQGTCPNSRLARRACKSTNQMEMSKCKAICSSPAALTTGLFVPLPPHNPYLGTTATSTMHGNAASSDSTYHPGPGDGSVAITENLDIKAVFASILMGKDGLLQAVATNVINETPYVYLLDPSSLLVLDKMELVYSSNALAGGIYSYIDPQDRLVLVNAKGILQRIAHIQVGGSWQLSVSEQVDIGYSGVIGLVPDYKGRVWFATAQGSNGAGATVGYYNPHSNKTVAFMLPSGEEVANSISSSPYGVAVSSTFALYLFRNKNDQVAQIWRQPYNRGPARKPGQLSWGTGATPVFFGPKTGYEHVTITDNASPQENILVYMSKTGQLISSESIGTLVGTENAPIASGVSIIIPSTYGYQYPPGAATGPSVPPSANFTGGLMRADLKTIKNRKGGSTLNTIWVNENIRSAALPRLSIVDGLIYTVELNVTGWYNFVSVDASDGSVLSRTPLGNGLKLNPLQMTGLISSAGILYQGVEEGLLRVQARQ